MASKPGGRKAYLAELADKGFIPPDHWTADLITLAELKRVAANAQIAAIAVLVPRRLGSDAEARELAGDKYLSRGLAQIYLGLWERLCETADFCDIEIDGKQKLRAPDDVDVLTKRALQNDDLVREGATIDWPIWWRTLDPRLRSRRRALATFALRRLDGSDVVPETAMTWGYRICDNIERELQQVARRFGKWEQKYVFNDTSAPERRGANKQGGR